MLELQRAVLGPRLEFRLPSRLRGAYPPILTYTPRVPSGAVRGRLSCPVKTRHRWLRKAGVRLIDFKTDSMSDEMRPGAVVEPHEGIFEAHCCGFGKSIVEQVLHGDAGPDILNDAVRQLPSIFQTGPLPSKAPCRLRTSGSGRRGSLPRKPVYRPVPGRKTRLFSAKDLSAQRC